jgi:hypothetical protein
MKEGRGGGVGGGQLTAGLMCRTARKSVWGSLFKWRGFVVSGCRANSVFSLSFNGSRTGRPGFDPRQRQRIFPLTSASRQALGPTQPPVQWSSFPGGRTRSGRDADHSPPSSAEVKKEQELYLLSPRCASMGRNGTALPLPLSFNGVSVERNNCAL